MCVCVCACVCIYISLRVYSLVLLINEIQEFSSLFTKVMLGSWNIYIYIYIYVCVCVCVQLYCSSMKYKNFLLSFQRLCLVPGKY